MTQTGPGTSYRRGISLLEITRRFDTVEKGRNVVHGGHGRVYETDRGETMTDFFDRAGGPCSDCGEPVGRGWPVVETCKTCLTELDRERISRQGGPVGRDEIVRMVQAAVADAPRDVRPYFTDEGVWEDIVAAADGNSRKMAQELIDAIIRRVTEHSAAAQEDRADAFGQDPTRRATSWAGRYDGTY